jgi:hypothetical protein
MVPVLEGLAAHADNATVQQQAKRQLTKTRQVRAYLSGVVRALRASWCEAVVVWRSRCVSLPH